MTAYDDWKLDSPPEDEPPGEDLEDRLERLREQREDR